MFRETGKFPPSDFSSLLKPRGLPSLFSASPLRKMLKERQRSIIINKKETKLRQDDTEFELEEEGQAVPLTPRVEGEPQERQ